MASTFIRYKGRRVQVPESAVTIVAYILFFEAAENATTADDKQRFDRMARDFDTRTVGTGCTDLALDQLLAGDPKREAEFLGMVKLTRVRVARLKNVLPAEYMEKFMPIPEYRCKINFSPWCHAVLNVIEALIRGLPLPRLPIKG